MKIHKDSHLDHGITDAQLGNLLERFEGRVGFFIATVELPIELGDVPCALFGPLMGDEPVPESEVVYRARGDRKYRSRIIETAYPRRSRNVTVIAGPHDGEPCVLYTAFGGPATPQEPGELKLQREAIERERMEYLKNFNSARPDGFEGCASESPGYAELTAKRDAVRDKHNASREFWKEHALIEVVGASAKDGAR